MVFKESILSETECHNLVKKYLNCNTFKVLKYQEKPFEDLKNYFKIKIEISKLVNFKVELIGKDLKGCVKNNYKSEVFSYETLYEDCSFIPKYCYGKENEFMIFEDFSKQNFKQPILMGVDHFMLALKNLAKMHAKSIQFEATMSSKKERPYQIIEECEDLKNGVWFQNTLEDVNAIVDLFPDDGLDVNIFKTEIANILRKFSSSDSKLSFRKVLCHGGLWDKNVLFKYDYNMKPVDCKFINFEYQHYNSPVEDVLQFIYRNTDQDFRKKHLHELLDFYYDCFKTELELEGLNGETTCSKIEDYEIAVHHFLPLIKIQTICLKYQQYLKRKGVQKLINGNHKLESKTLKRDLTESINELKSLVIHQRITTEDCFKIIKNKIGTTNYQLIEHQIVPLGKMGGYMGDHNKLKIRIALNKEQITLHLFAKFMPQANIMKGIEADMNAFYKEMFFYQQLVPVFKNYGVEAIDECATSCYFARYKDVMIFDDLEVQNYLSLDPRKPIDVELAKVAIGKLAKFHVSSLVFEERFSEKTKTKYSLLNDFHKVFQESLITPKEDHQAGAVVRCGVNGLNFMLELFPNTDENISISDEEMKIKLKKAIDTFYEVVKPSKEFRNVICHGDLWISNMLIQCFEGKPTDCRFVDFQLYRYCIPTQDLLSFIYLTTNRNLREQHFSNLIEFYYQELKQNIKSYGYDVEKVYPYEMFTKSVEYAIPQAVCQASIFFQLVLLNSDIVSEYMSSEETTRKFLMKDRRDFIFDMCKRDALFRERAGESMQDLREMCIKYF